MKNINEKITQITTFFFLFHLIINITQTPFLSSNNLIINITQTLNNLIINITQTPLTQTPFLSSDNQ